MNSHTRFTIVALTMAEKFRLLFTYQTVYGQAS